MAGKTRKRTKARKAKPATKRRPAKRPAPKRRFTSLAQVRAAIDAMDRKIVPLLCRRLHLVTQAAQFKPSVEGVVVVSRVEEVVENARRLARAAGEDPGTIETVYRVIIDAFTLQEQSRWRELHAAR